MREDILDYFAREYENADAREILTEAMNARAQQEMIRMPGPPVPPTTEPEEEPADEEELLEGDVSTYSLEEETPELESDYNPDVSLQQDVV
jgi:hypothetical protein